MITAESYAKMLLQKRNIRQVDLLKKMRELKLADDKTLVKPKLNEALNTRMGYTWARRIEIALDLPDYTLIKMIGRPSDSEWKAIKEIKKHV